MRKVCVLLSFLALAFALPAGAQMHPKTVARIVNIKVKPGMGPEFEAGLKKFHQWEHEHHFPVTYFTWAIISGDRTGQYMLGTFGHDWKDFDEIQKAAAGSGEQIQEDMGAYVESAVISYWVVRPGLSLTPPDPNAKVAPFADVTTFYLKPGDENDVEDVIKEVNTAIRKTQWPAKPSRWYSLFNGGDGAAMVLASDCQSWAEFQTPETSLGKMLAGAYGQDGAETLMKKFDKALKSVRTEIYRYQPDLSYIPASQ
jgi:hypothetical protein